MFVYMVRKFDLLINVNARLPIYSRSFNRANYNNFDQKTRKTKTNVVFFPRVRWVVHVICCNICNEQNRVPPISENSIL